MFSFEAFFEKVKAEGLHTLKTESVSTPPKQEVVSVPLDEHVTQAESMMQVEIALIREDAIDYLTQWNIIHEQKEASVAKRDAITVFHTLSDEQIHHALQAGRTDAAEKLMDVLQQKYGMPDYLDANVRTQYVDTLPDLKIDIPSFEGYPYQETALTRFLHEHQAWSEEGAQFIARKMIEDGSWLIPEDHAVYLEYERKEHA